MSLNEIVNKKAGTVSVDYSIDSLAEVLLDKEVIFKDNLEKIFGKRPYDKEDKLNEEEE